MKSTFPSLMVSLLLGSSCSASDGTAPDLSGVSGGSSQAGVCTYGGAATTGSGDRATSEPDNLLW